MALWINNRKLDEKSTDALISYFAGKNVKIHRLFAYAAGNRGADRPSTAASFFDKDIKRLHDIKKLKGVQKSFDIIKKAISDKERICIYGDYDVDGVMSTAIMYKALKGLGADVVYFIPDRVADGYGLNIKAVSRLIDSGCDLLITCDNGIAASNEIDYVNRRGVKTIVLDHHEPPVAENDTKQIIPPADAVADAKVTESGYKFSELCAGGLCYKFALGLYDYLGKDCDRSIEFLILAAIATVCDVVPLVDENRIIVHNGLMQLNSGKCKNMGLNALIAVTGVNKDGRKITERDCGFILGPCINASGRLELAAEAVEMLTTADENTAAKIAQRLALLNTERKQITADGIEKVERDTAISSNDNVIVAYIPDIHESVAGIIAGRIKDMYNRPTIILTDSNDIVKGSARSIEEYNMFLALSECRNVLLKFGGHSMAAGLSLERKNVDLLRRMLNKNCRLTAEDLTKKYYYDATVDFSQIFTDSVEQLDILRPFGTKNTSPLFVTKSVRLTYVRILGENKNVITMTANDGICGIKCIAFGKNTVDYILNIFDGDAEITADILYSPAINYFRGNSSVQLKLYDIKKK